MHRHEVPLMDLALKQIGSLTDGSAISDPIRDRRRGLLVVTAGHFKPLGGLQELCTAAFVAVVHCMAARVSFLVEHLKQ